MIIYKYYNTAHRQASAEETLFKYLLGGACVLAGTLLIDLLFNL